MQAAVPPLIAAPLLRHAYLEARGRVIILRYAFSGRSPQPFSVDPSRLHVVLSREGSGPSLVLNTSMNGVVESHESKMGPVYSEQVAQIEFPLPATTDAALYTVKVESPQGIDEPYPAMAYIPASGNDTELAKLRAAYTGRPAYVLGGLSIHCVNPGRPNTSIDAGVEPLSKLQVADVERSDGEGQTFSFESASRYRETPQTYLAVEPLVFRFSPSFSTRDIGVGIYATGPITPQEINSLEVDVQQHPEKCGAFTTSFSGMWDVARSLSSSNPAAGWSAQTVASVRKGVVAVGWTRAMVATALGYPSLFGTIDEMNRLEYWPYEEPAPFSHYVTFANDRVVKYEPPGQLP